MRYESKNLRLHLIFVGMLGCQAIPVHADGPGFTQPTGRTPGEVLATWDLSPTSSTRTTTAGYHRGYMFSDTRGLGIQTWDISNWSNPQEIEKGGGTDTNHHHFFIGDSYLNASGGANLATVWNLADMTNIVPASPPPFPFIRRGGNQRRDWFTLPFVYTGQNGYHPPQPLGRIVDARTDEVLAQIDYEGDLGFPGQPLAIGNLLLVAASQTSNGVAAYDVSDPRNPVLLDVIRGAEIGPGYEPAVWRHYVVLAMDDFGNSPDRVTLIDFSNPADLRLAGTINGAPGLSRYTQFQDRFMFVGDAKYDLEALLVDPDLTFNGTADAVLTFNGEDEYLLPLGNVVVTFDTGGGTTKAIVHNSQIDTTPPAVGYHLPADGAVNQALTSRIGLVINETLDTGSVNSSNIIVRPLGGSPLAGTLSQTDKDVVTFHPDALLLENTTYEVVLPAGGLKDASGNALASEIRFSFSTGSGTVVPDMPPVVNSVAVPYPVMTGSTVGLAATATDPDGTAPLEYRWDFGGGNETPWSTESTITHGFNQSGHITVVLSVRDAQGLVTVKPLKVTVVDTVPSGPMARNSGPILFDEAGDAVWVANPDSDTISRISANSLTRTAEFPVESKPMTLSMDPWGKLWVACAGSDTVEIVNPADGGSESIRFRYGSRPNSVLCDAFGRAFVSLEGSGEVVKIDVATRGIQGTLSLGPTPRALAIDATGARLFVTRFISEDSFGEVWEVGSVHFEHIRTYFLNPNTDPESDTGNDGRGLPNYLAGLAISPDNSKALVPSKKDNILRGGFIDGEPLTHDLTVRAITSTLDLTSGLEDFDARIDLDNSSQPSAAWFSPLGDYIFVVLQGNNEIDVFDTFTGQLATRILTGLAPQGLCYDPLRKRLFTMDFMDRTVSAFSLEPFLSAGQVPVVRSTAVPSIAVEKLSPPVLAGKKIFYNAADDRMSLDNYISCANCHLDGGHDGRTWDFTDRGEGLRNNITLQGRAGMSHGNVHWTGNFDEIQDFENDIRNAFGGDGFLPDADWQNPEIRNPLGSIPKAGRSAALDQLAAYVSSLGTQSLPRSPLRTELGKTTLQAQRGRTVFESANCASCHAGNDFTDGLRHDVGTIKASSGNRIGGPLDGIDTPGLLGLHETAPYLHDGSAPYLESVFEQFDATAASGSPRRAHDLGALQPQQRADLIRYLLELDSSSKVVSAPTATGYVEIDGLVSVEAENGEFEPGQSIWDFPTDAGASGGIHINSLANQAGTEPGSSEPARIVSYPMTLTGGDYQFHVHVRTPGGGFGDSFFWRWITPGALPGPWLRWGGGLDTAGAWGWKKWGTNSDSAATGTELNGLVQGLHTLQITYRETNTHLDKIVVQRAGMTAPVGFGPDETFIPVIPAPSGFVEQDGLISFEAENGDFEEGQTIWQILADPVSSSGNYISSPSNQAGTVPTSEDPARIARYPFTIVTGGDYQLFVRVNILGAGLGDSLFWRITGPGGSPSPWRRWWQGFGAPESWDWEPWASNSDAAATGQELFGLLPGSYVFEITYREANTKLDKFVIQKTGITAPAGLGPAETLPEAPTEPENQLTTLDEWKSFAGIPVNAEFGESPSGSGLSVGLQYALDLDADHHDTQSFHVDPATGRFTFTFIRYPNRANARYTLQGTTSLNSWTNLATASPGDPSMTNIFPETYSLNESFSTDHPDGIVTTLSGAALDAGFLRLSVDEVD